MKAMWDDRNNILHGEGNTIHRHKMRPIDVEIMQEWQIGLDLLPAEQYQYLFRGAVQQRIADTVHQKKHWLCSIWVARERLGSIIQRRRSKMAMDFYNRWKDKLQFQRECKALDETLILEWIRGIELLPIQQYGHLFQGLLQDKLGKPLHLKKHWICRVW